MRTTLHVAALTFFALLLVVIALGLLFPKVRLWDRWTAAMTLIGAVGAITHAYRIGEP